MTTQKCSLCKQNEDTTEQLCKCEKTETLRKQDETYIHDYELNNTDDIQPNKNVIKLCKVNIKATINC